MSPTLKQIHPDLYKRVKLKATTNTALGLALILGPRLDTINVNTNVANGTELWRYLPFDVWGFIFVAIGVSIFYGLFRPKNTYRFSRTALFMAFIYAAFWEASLLISVFSGAGRSASVLVLWSYFTYHLWLTARDSAWKGVEIIKKVEARINGH